MSIRGRIPWCRKIWTPEGLRVITEEEYRAIKLRKRNPNLKDMFFKDWGKTERLSRINSQAFANLRKKGIRNRDDVKARNSRIQEVAETISTKGWRDKSNMWIAKRLSESQERSVNTIRADVAEAKEFLMGSQNKKN